MTTVQCSQPEIVARLWEIHTARKAFDAEETELLTRLQRTKGNTVKPVPLLFGKNVISWGNGQALVIRGKGYKLVKALYEAKKMRLKEAVLDQIIWKGTVKHSTFVESVRRLAEKLEIGQFPYRLLPVKSMPKVESSGETHKGKPTLRYVPAEIIGVKLCPTKFSGKVGGCS